MISLKFVSDFSLTKPPLCRAQNSCFWTRVYLTRYNQIPCRSTFGKTKLTTSGGRKRPSHHVAKHMAQKTIWQKALLEPPGEGAAMIGQ